MKYFKLSIFFQSLKPVIIIVIYNKESKICFEKAAGNYIICGYWSICPMESPVFLKILTNRGKTASILSGSTM
ncbi:MAG: hypothetical protein JXN62_07575 [Bacteroidales bacterium]|nr:hypothetical protein [Bacteroidales bacterium]